MPIPPDARPYWPDLRDEDFEETSDAAVDYNCIAHAADNIQRWWSPLEGYYWPDEAPREVTVAAFVAAFGTLGYEPCEDSVVESEYEKIAIYVKFDNEPSHVAKQLSDGRWSSKLGMLIDIAHVDLECLVSNDYGRPSVFMRRPSVQED